MRNPLNKMASYTDLVTKYMLRKSENSSSSYYKTGYQRNVCYKMETTQTIERVFNCMRLLHNQQETMRLNIRCAKILVQN